MRYIIIVSLMFLISSCNALTNKEISTEISFCKENGLTYTILFNGSGEARKVMCK